MVWGFKFLVRFLRFVSEDVGLGFGVWGLKIGFMVWCFVFGEWCLVLGVWVWGLRAKVWGLRFGGQGLRSEV